MAQITAPAPNTSDTTSRRVSPDRVIVQLLKNHWMLLVVVALFIASMVFINPLRETAMQDDWAYARTVRHLLDTGEYHLDEWLSANIPFLAYWSAAFSLIFGYSQGILRLSTLVLEMLGLLACYKLAKVFDFSNLQAGVLVLVLFVSPVVFQLSYSFMTDVPLMSLLIIALYFYTRSLKEQSSRWALAGSIAAGAAIMTRQFGMALLVGWGAVWLFDPMRWRAIKRYAIGAIIPALAALWQLYVGGIQPNFAARYTFEMQRAFITQPPLNLAGELVWRGLMVALYLTLFVAPLAVGALLLYGSWLRQPNLKRRAMIILCLSAFAVLATYVINLLHPGNWPVMPFMPWNLYVSGMTRIPLTLVTLLCGVLLLPLLAKRIGAFLQSPLHEKLLDLTAVVSLLLILVFFQIGDEYLLVLVPFALFAVGRQLREQISQHSRIIMFASVTGLVLVALFTRYQIAARAAEWHAADTVHAMGVPEREINVIWAWNSYEGAFDDYVASTKGSLMNVFAEFFPWMEERQAAASYVVTRDPASVPGEIIYSAVSDEDFFRAQEIFVVRRDASAP